MEKKIDFRYATLSEFSSIHEQTTRRAIEQTRKQNEAAKMRNYNILQEIVQAEGHYIQVKRAHAESTAAIHLQQSRQLYTEYAERQLPRWRDHLAHQKLGILQKLHVENQDVENRRQRTAYELEREHQLHVAVEEERKQLMLSLALEQKEKLTATARSEIVKEQGRAVDYAIADEFSKYGQQYDEILASASAKSLQEAKDLMSKQFNDSIIQLQYAASNPTMPEDSVKLSHATMSSAMNTATTIHHTKSYPQTMLQHQDSNNIADNSDGCSVVDVISSHQVARGQVSPPQPMSPMIKMKFSGNFRFR